MPAPIIPINPITTSEPTSKNAWYRNDTVNELRYIRSERFAQEEGVGIWASPDHVAPWEWRKRHVEK